MLGAGMAYLTSQITAFIKKQATIYGLVALGGLIALFAAGYGLDALRAFLALRLGLVLASLIIAGGLLIAAGTCIGIAIWMSRSKPSKTQLPPLPLSSLPRPPALTASAIVAGGAITGLIAGVLAAKRPWERDGPVRSQERVDHRRERPETLF